MGRKLRSKGTSPAAIAAVALLLLLAAIWAYIDLTSINGLIGWLTGLPLALLFAVMIAFWCTMALIIWLVGDLLADPKTLETSKDSTARLLTIIAAFYAFLLGFVISQEWSNVTSVRNQVSTAAAALYTADYNAKLLPAPASREVRENLDVFTRSVVCQDFVRLRSEGRPATETDQALEGLLNAIQRQPQEVQQAGTFNEVVSQVEAVTQARRQWVDAANVGVPRVILMIVFLVATIQLGIYVLQTYQNRRVHQLATVGLAVFIALGTGLVVSLDRPFIVAARVDPSALTQGRAALADCRQVEPPGMSRQ